MFSSAPICLKYNFFGICSTTYQFHEANSKKKLVMEKYSMFMIRRCRKLFMKGGHDLITH